MALGSTGHRTQDTETQKHYMARDSSACGICLGVLFALIDLVLIALTIAFPVMKYTTHTEPYESWTDVQVFAPLITIAVLNVAVLCCACICSCIIASK